MKRSTKQFWALTFTSILVLEGIAFSIFFGFLILKMLPSFNFVAILLFIFFIALMLFGIRVLNKISR